MFFNVKNFTENIIILSLQLKRKSLDKKNKHGHWIVFDVKKTVNHWIKHPKENLGFVLRSSRSDMLELLGASTESSQDTVIPYFNFPFPVFVY